MNLELDSSGDVARASRFEPSRKVRLAWWLGLYGAAVVFDFVWDQVKSPEPRWDFMGFLGTMLGFPWELATWIALIVHRVLLELLGTTTLVVTYALYAFHLFLTLWLPGRKAFLLLMGILVAALLLNLAGCTEGFR